MLASASRTSGRRSRSAEGRPAGNIGRRRLRVVHLGARDSRRGAAEKQRDGIFTERDILLYVRERRLCSEELGFAARDIEVRANTAFGPHAKELERVGACADRTQRDDALQIEREELEVVLRDLGEDRQPDAAARLFGGCILRRARSPRCDGCAPKTSISQVAVPAPLATQNGWGTAPAPENELP